MSEPKQSGALDIDAIYAKRRARAVEEDKARSASLPPEPAPGEPEMTADDLGL